MVARAKCNSCGDSAVIHVTDVSSAAAVTSHLCASHGHQTHRQELRRIASLVWRDYESRESAAEFIASEPGLPRVQVLRQLADSLMEL